MNALAVIIILLIIAIGVWYYKASQSGGGGTGGSPGGSPSVPVTCTPTPLYAFATTPSQCTAAAGGTVVLTEHGKPAVGGVVYTAQNCSDGSANKLAMAPYTYGDGSQLWWFGSAGGTPPALEMDNYSCGKMMGWWEDGTTNPPTSGPGFLGSGNPPSPTDPDQCNQGSVTLGVQVNSDNTLSVVGASPDTYLMIDPNTLEAKVTGDASQATAWDAQVCVPQGS